MVVLFVGTVLLMASLTGCSVFSPGSASPDTGDTSPTNLIPPPEVQWAHAFGGTQSDQFDAVAVTADSDFIGVGYTTSGDGDLADTHDTYSSGAMDAVVACVTADGTLRWAHTFGGTGDDRFMAVAIAPDGNIVVAGYTDSVDGDFPMKSPTAPDGSLDSSDAVVAEISPEGSLEWATTIGGSGQDSFGSVAVGADGTIFAGGTTTVTDGDFTGEATRGAVLAEITQSGRVQWAKVFGGGYGTFDAVALRADGTVIAAGFTAERIGTPQDGWVMALTEDADTTWTRTYGGSGPDEFSALALAPDGSMVVTGRTFSTDGDFPSDPHIPYGSAVVADITDDGSISWTHVVGTGDATDYRAAAVSSDGNIVVSGSLFPKGSHHPNQALLAEYTASGTFLWSKTLVGSSNIIFNGVATTCDGAIVAVGITMSSQGDIVSTHGAQTDAAIAELVFPDAQL